MRPIASGTISFGLVALPFRLYVAALAEDLEFNLVHDACGSRLRQKYVCPECGAEVPREHQCRGLEVERGGYVKFTEEELSKLDSPRTGMIEVSEFVLDSALSPEIVEKTYYIGPDKGGDKAQHLLATAMRNRRRVAIGRYFTRGRTQLVALEPHPVEDLIYCHYLFFGTEIRSYEEALPAKTSLKTVEVELAEKLVDKLSVPNLRLSKYKDDRKERIARAAAEKAAGRELVVETSAPEPTILDVFEALKRSLQ
jgi:DNA end-binding protein Ku